MKYNAFISYSHSQDSYLAPSFEKGLEQLAKPTFKRRALNIFRDANDLSASPDLWGKIEKGLDQSEYFIYFASPKSANSFYCNKEVEHWLNHKSMDKFLVALTDGEMNWDHEQSDFDWLKTTAIPKILSKAFKNEPLYVDFRNRQPPEELNLDHPDFKSKVVQFAATIHNKAVGDMIGEDVRQHKKTIRIRNSAIAIFTILMTLAMLQFRSAAKNAEAAVLHFRAQAELTSDPTVALRLEELAISKDNKPEYVKSANNILNSHSFYKIGYELPDIYSISIFDTIYGFTRNYAIEEVFISFSLNQRYFIIKDFVNFGKTPYLDDLNKKVRYKMEGHRDIVQSAAISPNGNNILTGSRDSTAILWTNEAEIIRVFTGHKGSVTSVAFSPDGQRILTGSRDNTVRLWNLTDDQFIELKGHTGSIMDIKMSADGKYILTGSMDRTARLWDIETDQSTSFVGHTATISSVSFSPDEKSVLTGSYDKTAKLWNLKGVVTQEFKGHSGLINVVEFSPEGKNIITGSEDNTARLWNLEGATVEEFKFNFPKDPAGVNALAFSPDDNSIILTTDKKVLFFKSRHKITQCGVPGITNASVAILPDKELIITGTVADSVLRLWDFDGVLLDQFPAHTGSNRALKISPDGNKFASGGGDGIVRLWDFEGNIIREFPGHKEWINSVDFSPDGRFILSGSFDGTARLWDVNGEDNRLFSYLPTPEYEIDKMTEEEYEESLPPVEVVAFSPIDNELFLTGHSSENLVYLWSTEKKEPIQKFNIPFEFMASVTDDIRTISFAPDGKKFIVGSSNGNAYLCDTNGKILRTINNESDKSELESVLAVAFINNGESILISQRNSVRLFNLKGEVLSEYGGEGGNVFYLSDAPGGNSFFSGNRDNTVRRWITLDYLESGLIQDYDFSF